MQDTPWVFSFITFLLTSVFSFSLFKPLTLCRVLKHLTSSSHHATQDSCQRKVAIMMVWKDYGLEVLYTQGNIGSGFWAWGALSRLIMYTDVPKIVLIKGANNCETSVLYEFLTLLKICSRKDQTNEEKIFFHSLFSTIILSFLSFFFLALLHLYWHLVLVSCVKTVKDTSKQIAWRICKDLLPGILKCYNK